MKDYTFVKPYNGISKVYLTSFITSGISICCGHSFTHNPPSIQKETNFIKYYKKIIKKYK